MAGTRMLQRRGTAAQWAAANPVLGAGEFGVEGDTHFVKVGDGTTAWNALPYHTGPQGSQGTQGRQGFQGTQGVQGVQGTQGYQGTQGFQGTGGGAQGPQGVQGATGVSGAQGYQGTQGPQGVQGITGSTGTQGPQGTQGASSLTVVGSVRVTATTNLGSGATAQLTNITGIHTTNEATAVNSLMQVTINAVAGRRYRIRGAGQVNSSVAGDTVALGINQTGTVGTSNRRGPAFTANPTYCASTSYYYTIPLDGYFDVTTSGTLILTLGYMRMGGSGSIMLGLETFFEVEETVVP